MLTEITMRDVITGFESGVFELDDVALVSSPLFCRLCINEDQ